jgi:uncharacterized protein (DUF2141 family)
MKRQVVFTRLVLGALVGLAGATAQAQEGTLTIRATGFVHARGHAVAKLYLPGENVRSKQPHLLVRSEIHEGAASFAFPGLPFGTYAVVVFHDENDNGEIDHNLVGLPIEPLGFSNGFALGLLSGMPTFEKLQFPFGPGTPSIDIRVK